MEPAQVYLYRIQPARPEMLSEGAAPGEEAVIDEHFHYLEGLLERGVVLLAGRTLNSDPTSFGIVIFKVESETQARMVVENDPAVRGGVMQAELFAYRIALVSPDILK